MDRPNIGYYTGLSAELGREFRDVVTMFEKIEDMVYTRWALDPQFTAVIKDVMAVIDTAPSDAINSGAIALASNMPVFSVSPQMANVAEYDRAQRMEDNIDFHFRKANTRGNGSFMNDIAESSLKYNTNCVRVDDLVRILPKDSRTWTPLQKQAWSYGRFIHKVINPKRVRYIFNDYGLNVVNHVDQIPILAAVNWLSLHQDAKTSEGRMIMQALADLKQVIGWATDKEKGNFSLTELYLNQNYILEHDKLVIWGSLSSAKGEPIEHMVQDIPAQFVFAFQDNPYGFMNWSIRVAGSRIEEKKEQSINPLLAPLYWSQSWDKLNLAKSIIFSEPIRRARDPRAASETYSGEAVQVDHQQGSAIKLKVGEKYTPFSPITMDAQALAVVAQLEAAMNRTTGASMIGDTTKISSNTPFSTFSAMVKVALSRLDKQNNNMALTCQDVACLDLWWVDKTGVPLESYALADKQYRSGTNVPRGKKQVTKATDFNPLNIGISAKCRPNTPTDRMEQLNMAVILSTKMNMPVSMMLEEMGYENVGLAYELWSREFLQTADIQGQAAALQQKYLMEQQMQQQMAMAGGGGGGEGAPMGAGGDMAETSFGALGGMEGFNPAMGGGSAAGAAPTMTREALSGATQMQSR